MYRVYTISNLPVPSWSDLGSHFLTFISVLRLGKSLEMIYQAKQALHIQDIVIQTCVTLSRIASACFLFLDHIIWLQRAKAINIDIKPISDISNQFWLLSTAINLVRNIYDWNRIYAAQQLDKRRRESARIEQPPSLSVALDTVKNLCDILIPLNGLGHIQVSGVVQGATGVVSSIIGIATVWDDNLKCLNK